MEFTPLPEEEVLDAEEAPTPDHDHDGLAAEDDTLLDHLRSRHGLEAPDSLSSAAVIGLHDRLHGERHAELDLE